MSHPDPQADRFIDSIESLPPAPRILPELLGLLQDADSNADRITKLIAHDPALTARTLKLCNSARFRGSQPVHDLQGAVLRLGFNQLYQIVAGLVGKQTVSGAQPGYGIAQGELWKHSAATAVAGKVLAPEVGLDPNLLFTAALLHDLGKLALNTTLHQRYDEIVALIDATGRTFLEVEQELLGTDHARVGGRLLARWNFPESLREAIRFHHDPTQAGSHQRLAAGILLADMLAHLTGYGVGHFAFAVRAHPEIHPILNLGQQDIERLIASTQTALGEFELLKGA